MVFSWLQFQQALLENALKEWRGILYQKNLRMLLYLERKQDLSKKDLLVNLDG